MVTTNFSFSFSSSCAARYCLKQVPPAPLPLRDKETLNQQLQDLQQQMNRLFAGPQEKDQDAIDVEHVAIAAKADEADSDLEEAWQIRAEAVLF